MRKNWIVKKLNKKYFLRFGKIFFKCQVGEAGLIIDLKKTEGDKATPIGVWKLKSVYYRNDRILRPRVSQNKIKLNQITDSCGWCDDVNSRYYNKYINIKNFLPSKISFEKLWREDNAYDIIMVISHNTKPIIKNKGSAIFIHCSFEDIRPTAGCIALKKRDLINLIKNLKDNVCIEIKK